MTLGLLQIGLGKIEAERGQPGPGLFDEIEKAARPATNVEKTQPALVAPGEGLAERRQGIDTLTIGPQEARPLRSQFMRPQLSHRSKSYALRSGTVDASDT